MRQIFMLCLAGILLFIMFSILDNQAVKMMQVGLDRNQSSRAKSVDGTLITAIDIRIGHEPSPVLVKINKCFYQALANSKTLGQVELTPIKKNCNSVETKIEASSIVIKAEELVNALTGETINMVKAGTPINIVEWE